MTFTVIAANNKFEGTLFGHMNNLVNLKYFDVRKSSLCLAIFDKTIYFAHKSNLIKEITT